MIIRIDNTLINTKYIYRLEVEKTGTRLYLNVYFINKSKPATFIISPVRFFQKSLEQKHPEKNIVRDYSSLAYIFGLDNHCTQEERARFWNEAHAQMNMLIAFIEEHTSKQKHHPYFTVHP